MEKVLEDYGIGSVSELEEILSKYFEYEDSIRLLEEHNVDADELEEILSKYSGYKRIIESIEESLVDKYSNETYELSDVPYLLEEHFELMNLLSETNIMELVRLYEQAIDLHINYVKDIETLLGVLPKNKQCDLIREVFGETWPIEFTIRLDDNGIEISPKSTVDVRKKLEAIKRLIEIVINSVL